MTTTETKQHKGKLFSGVVSSAKMDKTVIVTVTRYVKHPKYGKFIKRKKRYAVHVPEGMTFAEGDKVAFQETTPISKTKRFIAVATQ